MLKMIDKRWFERQSQSSFCDVRYIHLLQFLLLNMHSHTVNKRVDGSRSSSPRVSRISDHVLLSENFLHRLGVVFEGQCIAVFRIGPASLLRSFRHF